MKKHRKHWKKLSVHPLLHDHIVNSPILSPMAVVTPNEEAGEIVGQPDPDDESLPQNPFAMR